jgi:hypothetical protein
MAGSRSAFALASWLLIASSAVAADREVRLRLMQDVAPKVPAFPRIAHPIDDAEREVNLALDRLDAAVRKAGQDCRRESKGRASWERMIGVPISAPGFLSFYFGDNVYCGGAHPSVGAAAIVYDLRSGAPIDWTRFLPPTLTGEVAMSETSDGSKITTLSSARLHRLYLDSYRPKTGNADDDAADDECREAVASEQNGKPPGMIVWLKEKEGLAVQLDLVHAVQACSDEVAIPAATLKAEGASADLIRALETAHAAHFRR